MALADQALGFFIPTVSLMGIGSAEEAGTPGESTCCDRPADRYRCRIEQTRRRMLTKPRIATLNDVAVIYKSAMGPPPGMGAGT